VRGGEGKKGKKKKKGNVPSLNLKRGEKNSPNHLATSAKGKINRSLERKAVRFIFSCATVRKKEGETKKETRSPEMEKKRERKAATNHR